MNRKIFLICVATLVVADVATWFEPIDWNTVHYSAYQTFEEDNNPIGRYLWVWIKYACYGLGGVAGASGLLFGIFGFWVGRGQIIKQGIISTIAGFAFILVIPTVRIIFDQWVEFAEAQPYIPELQNMLWVWGL